MMWFRRATSVLALSLVGALVSHRASSQEFPAVNPPCLTYQEGTADLGFGERGQQIKFANACPYAVYMAWWGVSHGRYQWGITQADPGEHGSLIGGADNGSTITYRGSCLTKGRDCYRMLALLVKPTSLGRVGPAALDHPSSPSPGSYAATQEICALWKGMFSASSPIAAVPGELKGEIEPPDHGQIKLGTCTIQEKPMSLRIKQPVTVLGHKG